MSYIYFSYFLIGLTALSIIYAVQLALDTSQYGVRQCAEVENFMTSVERVVTYTELTPETGYGTETKPPKDWPNKGRIAIKDMSLVYYPGGPKILKNLNFQIMPGEKIGIAGRTGAGKSSLVSALFRMPEPRGEIFIDDVDFLSLNLQKARQGISVITQDPVLFNSTLRMNLDPFERYADHSIWQALEGASLKPLVEGLSEQLSHEVTECGSNFSVGERQLICLARALLLRNKVIIMDEATANVDYKTDKLIHNTIRTQFEDCTVITIAHRLDTILSYDRVMVLEDGQVVEFDTPEILLRKDHGALATLYYSQHDRLQCVQKS